MTNPARVRRIAEMIADEEIIRMGLQGNELCNKLRDNLSLRWMVKAKEIAEEDERHVVADCIRRLEAMRDETM